MELSLKDVAVVVASHQEPIFRNLKPPYLEVCMDLKPSKPFGFSHYITKDMSRLKFPEAWSEIAVLLEFDSFIGDSKIVGLQHYRRFFSFTSEVTSVTISNAPNMRNEFVENQIKDLLEIEEQIVIPVKWEFTESVLEQFVSCHPKLEELFLFTLNEFDKLLFSDFGAFSSLAFTQEKTFLYPCNMFIGPREFYSEWHTILTALIPKIEERAEKFDGQLGERWGGYIAERLFSIYITLCQVSNRWTFIEKAVVVFDGLDELTQQRDELTQQRDELTQQRDELTQQRDELTQQRDELTQQRDELTQQLSRILLSKSWMLTSPFRKIVAVLLSLKNSEKLLAPINSTDSEQVSSIECLKFDKQIYASAHKAKSFINSIETLRFALENAILSGVALEFGVFSGRTLKIISEYFPGNTYGFDTFEGLPEDWREGFLKGTFKLDEIPVVENANIVVGLFQDTLSGFIETMNKPISFIHLDADLYSSTKYVLSELNHRIEEGCVILFDEFMNYPSFERHEYLAFIEWAEENSRSHRAICYTDTHEQMGFLITN
jgi:hypothetical protein